MTVDEAVAAAERIGYPVVIKPLDGNHGRGVTVNIVGEDGVADAFETAEAEDSAVVVETSLRGDDHRLLVVNGQLAPPRAGCRGHVKGDGRHHRRAGWTSSIRPAPWRRARERADPNRTHNQATLHCDTVPADGGRCTCKT